MKKDYIGTTKESDAQFASGQLVQMCVLHRLSPDGKDVQSMSVIGGLSVCSNHLESVANSISDGCSLRDILSDAKEGNY